MSNEDSELDRILNDHFEEARKAELPAGSWARLAARPDTVASAPGRSNVRRRMWFAAAAAVLVVSAGAIAIVNAGDDDQSVRTDNPTAPQSSLPAGPSGTTVPGPLAEFCAVFETLAVEVPESFIGSNEHIAGIKGLLDVSPKEIRPEVQLYFDFLDGGGIDLADPNSNLTENFPAPVQAALKATSDFAAANCPKAADSGDQSLSLEQPALLAAVLDTDGDGLGDIVLVDTVTGEVVKTIYEAPPPNEFPEGGPYGAINVDMGPDGVVYYEICCEPAVGVIRRYDPTSDESRDLGYGEHPAVSPDGKLVAVANQTIGLVLLDTSGSLDQPGDNRQLGLFDGADGRLVTRLAWSPDGSTLAVESTRLTNDGMFSSVGVDLVDVATLEVTPVATDSGPDGVAMPVFLPGGSLLLIATDASQGSTDGGPIEATSFVIYDQRDNQLYNKFDLPKTVELEGSAVGLWVIASESDGSIQIVLGPDGLKDVRIPLNLSRVTGHVAKAAW